jgi:hypothetical protein
MQVDVPQILSTTLFVAWVGCMAFLSGVFVVHFFVPKILLERYFKPPHFSEAEIQFFTSGVAAYIRTVMFMRLVSKPACGKKRNLMGVHQDSPSWFVLFSKTMLIAFYLFGSGFAFSCLALLIHSVV